MGICALRATPQPAELHLPAGGHPVLARRRVRHPSHWPNAKPPFSPYGLDGGRFSRHRPPGAFRRGAAAGPLTEGEVIVSRLEKFHLGCRKQKTLVGVCRRLEPARGLGCFSALIKQTTEER